MNAHIININCNKKQFEHQYLQQGYIGVGLVLNGTSSQQLLNACRTTYSMYADMKTVFPGDMIFLHVEEYIYGVFKAESFFKEDPTVDPHFLSDNIYYNPNQPHGGWKELETQSLNNLPLPPPDYRQLSISHFVDEKGNNLCFKEGFFANEVFDLRRKGKIWSIPERWRYPDSARTIRPIMPAEALELIKLLERENSHTLERRTLKPKDLTNFRDIRLILNPSIVEDEKIIEAWLCENLRTPKLQQIFGNITSFGNNVQIGYLQGIDIFGYTQGSSGICKYKVIEIKMDEVNANNYTDVVKQILDYMDWVCRHLAKGDSRFVEGYIVAKSFDQSCIDFVKNHNKVNIGKQIFLVNFNYCPSAYNTLQIERVV